MRTLDVEEINVVSGGMQAADGGSGNPLMDWFERFYDFLDSMWSRWQGGGGGPLTQKDIDAYCFGTGLAQDVGGRYFVGGQGTSMEELCNKAVENAKKMNTSQQQLDELDKSLKEGK